MIYAETTETQLSWPKFNKQSDGNLCKLFFFSLKNT